MRASKEMLDKVQSAWKAEPVIVRVNNHCIIRAREDIEICHIGKYVAVHGQMVPYSHLQNQNSLWHRYPRFVLYYRFVIGGV